MSLNLILSTVAWVWISMNEARIEDLLRENFEQFTIYIGNIELILFDSIDITDFIAIDPFGCQNALIRDSKRHDYIRL